MLSPLLGLLAEPLLLLPLFGLEPELLPEGLPELPPLEPAFPADGLPPVFPFPDPPLDGLLTPPGLSPVDGLLADELPETLEALFLSALLEEEELSSAEAELLVFSSSDTEEEVLLSTLLS